MTLTEERDRNFEGRMTAMREHLKGSDAEVAAYAAVAQAWFYQGFEQGVRLARERIVETVTQTQREMEPERF